MSFLGAGTGTITLDIADALRKADVFKRALGGVQAAGETLGRGFGGLSGALEAPFRAMSGIATSLGAIGLAANGLGALRDAVGGVVSGLTAGNAEMENYTTQLGTLMGGADAARERLAELAKFGAETPFELPEVVRAEKVLLGFGLTGQKAIDLTRRNASDLRTIIGDIAAGTGASFEEIALNFGKFSSGATGEAISRLQEMGIVTREQMTAMGVEFSKSGELVSPLPQAMAVAVDIAQQKFGGGMQKLSQTLDGQLSTLSDNWNQGLRQLTAPLADVVKEAVGQLNNSLSAESFQAGLTKVSEILRTVVVGAVDAARRAFETLVPIIQTIGTVATRYLTGNFDGLRETLDGLPASLRPIADATLAVITTFRSLSVVVGGVLAALQGATDFSGVEGGLRNLLDTFRAYTGLDLSGVIGPFMTGLQGLTGAVQAARDVVASFIGALQGDWQPAPGIQLFAQLAGLLGLAIKAAIPLVGSFFTALQGGGGASATTGVLDSVRTAAQQLSDFIGGPGTDAVKSFIGALSGTWQPAPGIGQFASLAGQLGLALKGAGDAISTVFDLASKLGGALGDVSLRFRSSVEAQSAFVSLATAGAAAWVAMTGAAVAHQVALTVVSVATRAYAAAQAILNAVLTANPIGIIVVGIAALAAGLIYAYNNSEQFRAAVDGLWASIQSGVATIAAFVASVGANLTGAFNAAVASVNAFKQQAGDALNGIPGLVTGAVSGVIVALTGVWANATGVVSSAVSAIGAAIQGGWDAATATVQATMATIGDAIVGGWDAARGAVEGAIGGIRDSILGIWNSIPEDIRADLDLIVSMIVQRFGDQVATVTQSAADIQAAIGAAWEGAGAAIQGALEGVVAIVTDVWGRVRDGVSAQVGQVADAAQAGWALLVSGAAAALAPLVSIVQGAWDQVTAQVTAAMTLLQSIVQLAWAAIPALFGAGIALVSGYVSTWLAGLTGQVSGTFQAVNATIATAWDGIVATIQGSVTRAVEAVTRLGADILTQARGLAGQLGDAMAGVGAAMVAGITGAVTGAGNAIGAALLGSVRAAIDYTKRALGISSPSKQTADEIGKPLGQGVLAGFQSVDLAGALGALVDLVNAAADRIGTKAQIDRFQSAAQAISGAAGAVKATFDAFRGSEGAVRPSMELLDALTGTIGDVLAAMTRLSAGVSDTLAERIGQVSQAASSALGAFKGAIDAVAGLSSVVAPKEGAVGVVVGVVRSVFGEMAALAGEFGAGQVTAIGTLGGAVKAAMDGLAASLKPITDVGKVVPPGVNVIPVIIDQIRTVLAHMTALAQGFDTRQLTAIPLLGKAIEASFGGLAAALGPLKDINRFRVPDADLTKLFDSISGVTIRFRDLALAFSKDQADLTRTVGDAVKSAFGAVGDALKIIPNLATAKISDISGAMATLVAQMRTIFDAVIALGEGFGPDTVAKAATFAGGAGQAIELVAKGVAAVSALKDVPEADPSAVRRLRSGLRTILDEIISLSADMADRLTAQAVTFSKDAADALGVLGSIPNVLKLKDFAKNAPSTGDIADFFAVFKDVVAAMVDESKRTTPEIAKAAGEVGAALSDAFGGLGAALGFFLKLPEFDPGKNFADQLGAVLYYLRQAVSDMKGLATEAGDVTAMEAFSVAVRAMAEALSAFVEAAIKAAGAKDALASVIATIGKLGEANRALAGTTGGAPAAAAASVVEYRVSGEATVNVNVNVPNAGAISDAVWPELKDEVKAEVLDLIRGSVAA